MTALTTALALILCHDASAATPTEELERFFTAAAAILNDPATEGNADERLRAGRKLVADLFDFREAAKTALGREWQKRTSAERDEFVRLFTDLLERSYISSIVARIRFDDGIKVNYVSERIQRNSATVLTTVAGKDGTDVAFEYRMWKRGDRWAIHDVIVDGVSLVRNYQVQFTRVIQSSSYAELVERMRAKAGTVPPAVETAETTRRESPRASASATTSSSAKSSEPAEPPRDRKDLVGERGAVSKSTAEPSSPAAAALPYWVQVGAYKNAETARRFAASLREGVARVSTPPLRAADGKPRQSLSRVLVGPFAVRAAAVSKLRELQTRGYEAFITREAVD